MMKKYLLYSFIINCSLVLPLMAETLEDYAYQIKLTPIDDSALQKIILTNDVYIHSKNSQLNDLNVFDSKGQVMPFEISQNILSVDEDVEKIINLYPLFEKTHLANQTQNIFLSYNDKQQLDHLEKTVDKKTEQHIVGYILDLGERPENKFSQFEFELSKVNETRFLHMNIDQSKDLKHWSRLSSNEVLAQLFNQQVLAQHNKLHVSGINARYLRLTITDQSIGFDITAAKQKYTVSQKNDVILWQPIYFAKKVDDDFLSADVADTIPMQFLKFDLDEQYSFLNGQLFYKRPFQTGKKHPKNKPKSAWQSYSAVNLYQVKDGENQLSKKQIDLQGLKTQALKLQLNYPALANNETVLNAQIGWKAQSLVFLAGGDAPYYVVVGRQQNPNQVETKNNNHNSIISNIKNQLNGEIPEATIVSTKVNQQQVSSVIIKTSLSKIVLWLVLILGVGLMLWMARNLLKQIGREE